MKRGLDSVVEPKVRRVVLEGTFSMEEIEMAGKPRRKKAKAGPAKPAKKKVARKKTAKKKATRRRAATKTVAKKKAAPPARAAVAIDSRQTIKNIGDLEKQLEAAASGGAKEVEIDLGSVETVDTAVLQLLVGFANDMDRKSVSIDWKTPSADFLELADLVDLRPRGAVDAGAAGKKTVVADDGLLPVF